MPTESRRAHVLTGVLVVLMVIKAAPLYAARVTALRQREAELLAEVLRARSTPPPIMALRTALDSLSADVDTVRDASAAAGHLASLVSDAASAAGMAIDAMVPEADSTQDGALLHVKVRGEATTDIGRLATFLMMIDGGNGVRLSEAAVLATNPDDSTGQERLHVRVTIDGAFPRAAGSRP